MPALVNDDAPGPMVIGHAWHLAAHCIRVHGPPGTCTRVLPFASIVSP